MVENDGRNEQGDRELSCHVVKAVGKKTGGKLPGVKKIRVNEEFFFRGVIMLFLVEGLLYRGRNTYVWVFQVGNERDRALR